MAPQVTEYLAHDDEHGHFYLFVRIKTDDHHEVIVLKGREKDVKPGKGEWHEVARLDPEMKTVLPASTYWSCGNEVAGVRFELLPIITAYLEWQEDEDMLNEIYGVTFSVVKKGEEEPKEDNDGES